MPAIVPSVLPESNLDATEITGLRMATLRRYLPRGNTLDDEAWTRRHRIVLAVLAIHLPAIFAFGVGLGYPVLVSAEVIGVPLLCLVLAHLIKRRRVASVFATAGLTSCSVALVGLSHGTIEAHFHFFIIIGFIALYQDWVPFLWNIAFTVLSHGIGSLLYSGLMFNHHAGQAEPWLWSGIHGGAVAIACIGVVLFWRVSEDDQLRVNEQKRQADTEAGRRRFTSDLLVNLARRNQKMLYRQLEIINQLEDKERDPDVLGELFQLEHLATRVRRNAESLLVLSGESTARVWSAPVPLREVVQAAIAETEDLDRVTFTVDEGLAIAGNCVADVTHLLAELTENAVRFSPPKSTVSIAQRPYPHLPGAQLLTVEDWGVGMPPAAIAAANQVLATAPEVDLAVSRQLGFHVVARLAKQHGLTVSLTPTPGAGVTAAVVMPAELFGPGSNVTGRHVGRGHGHLPPPALGLGQVRVDAPQRHNSMLLEMDDDTERREQTTLRRELANSRDRWWRDGDGNDEPANTESEEEVTPAMIMQAEPAPAMVLDTENEETASPEPKLARRRPQTHLAPELRHPVPRPRAEYDVVAETPAAPPPPAPDALSQYQASRHAARAVAERRAAEREQPR